MPHNPDTLRKDLFDLDRFVSAQEEAYQDALSELQAGKKRSHWMWFIFPQFAGLGFSPTSKHYAIKSKAEAEAYLAHPVLGPRLIACTEAVLATNGRSAHDIFGSPDDMKLKSSMTLFQAISEQDSVFAKVLEKYYHGQQDTKTLELMNNGV